MKIVDVTPEDAEELRDIYAVYVRETAATFEYTPPTAEEFRGRIISATERYPYLKAVDDDGRALGFAFAHCLRARRAYDWSVETTIYIRKDCRRTGAGSALYGELEKRLRAMGVCNMYACVAFPQSDDDPYLTMASPEFHKKMGFEIAGMLHSSGNKFGRWYDMGYLEKIIGDHKENPAPVFQDVKGED